jgi:hypothetical protein
MLTSVHTSSGPVYFGICGGQCSTGTSFSPGTKAFPRQYHSTKASYLSDHLLAYMARLRIGRNTPPLPPYAFIP